MSIIQTNTQIKRIVSHLLLSGHNPQSPPLQYSARSLQSPSNPLLTSVPFSSWIGSIGRAADVANGWNFVPNGLASGLEHSLLAYRSLGTDRIFGVGRNEVGQIGIGYNSHEGTRGLVEGFKGEKLIQTAASCQSSFMLLGRENGESALYVAGNLGRGRLGAPEYYIPQEDGLEEPDIHALPAASLVNLPEGVGGIKELAVGFEHLLVLTDKGEIFGSGCNTDGQLGLGKENIQDVYTLTRTPLPPQIQSEEGGIKLIRAGGDTSALITNSGNLYTWGNSEYGQALQGKKIDQILIPTRIDESFLSLSRRVVDFQCGGSFSLVLDNYGSVYSVGFGALGLGPNKLESQEVTKIEALEGLGITRIRAAFGYAVAIRDDGVNSAIYTWGLNNLSGRLGVGSIPPPPLSNSSASKDRIGVPPKHIYLPTELDLPKNQLEPVDREVVWSLGEITTGQEALWVEMFEELIGEEGRGREEEM